MSGFYVSWTVWNNCLLAASRFPALMKSARALSRELGRAAERSLEARREYGDEFPAWSYGSGKLPGYLGNLAEVAARAQEPVFKYERGETLEQRNLRPEEFESFPRDVDKLESFVNDLAGRVAEAEKEFKSFTALKSLRAHMRAHMQAQTQAQAAEELQEEVSRLFDTLDADVSPEDRTALEQKASETVNATQEFRRRALLAQLHLDVQRANEAGKARQRAVEQAEQWRVRLLGLEGQEVEALDKELRQVVDRQRPLPPDMEQKVDDVVARAIEASNRDYAMGVITEELQNLGYVVEAGFETASAQEPEILLRKADMEADYHVSLRADAGGLHNRVVREAGDPGEPAPARKRTDEQMERNWCKDLAAALAAAEHRGVRGRAATLNPPGEAPVPVIAPLKSKRKPESTSRRKRTGRLRSRMRR